MRPCSSPGDNQSAGSWDREIDGSFSLSLYSCLVVICVWSLVTSWTRNTSCSRSGSSLMLIHCLIHKSYCLFYFSVSRVQFYIPIKWIAESKLAVNRSWLVSAKFCHRSWVLTGCILIPDWVQCSRSGLDCLPWSSLRYLELHLCLTDPELCLWEICQGTLPLLWHLSRSVDHLHGS